jgi:hypothetical protein
VVSRGAQKKNIMGDAQFKDAATRIAGLFEACGAAAAIAEQERVNQTLKRKNLYIRFRGRPEGLHLAFRLYRSEPGRAR